MNSSKITEAANRLWVAQNSGEVCSPIRDLIGTTDLVSAYRIQEINTKRKIDRGETIVGRKVGLTSFAVQKQLGVDQPDFGSLTNATQCINGGSLSVADLMQPKAEAELAFILKRDLVGEITLESVANAIDYACASIEIVGSRVANWDISITDTIADNASASHFVLGDAKVSVESINLVHCAMSMTRNGELVSEGNGEACMGNPLHAVVWLANTMISMKTPLRAGEIILSGALGLMVPVEQGDVFHADIEGVGAVDIKFS